MPVIAGTQYAQPSDLANLGLIGGVLASISTATQNAALQAASAVADSQLQGAFILPLTQWSYDLVRAVCIIAAYDLLTSKGYNPATGADPNIRARYADAMSWLDRVSKGQESPAYIIDSSTSNSGQTTPPPADGSTVYSTQGGFQLQTTSVRGWTDRGLPSPPFDNGTGPL